MELLARLDLREEVGACMFEVVVLTKSICAEAAISRTEGCGTARSGHHELRRNGVLTCNQRVGKQQRLAGAVYVADLPRNPNGKVLKRELRKQYADWEKAR